MADNSTTETGADQHSSGSQDESLLDNQQEQSADEQQGTGSSDTQSQDSGHSDDDGRQDDTTQESDDSSNDDDLKKFAKAQGFDPDNLSDGERRALKLARDNQRAFHTERQNQSNETKDVIEKIHQPDEDNDDFETRLLKEFSQLKAQQKLNEFYTQNPDARDYDKEMALVLAEEDKTYGSEAAQRLAQNMPRLLREAKASRGDGSAEAAREAGRREERERIRHSQEGSAEGGSASHTQQTSGKLTREWVQNEYDASNPEHRQMLDDALARGELY